ncbi:S-layer homology domain-containing protein [Lutibacter sp. B2]|nr:S-layer homology domain-containing protein [Lutibacter sp. B2]
MKRGHKNKMNKWLARLMIITIFVIGIPIENVYGQVYENNKATFQWKKTFTYHFNDMDLTEELSVTFLSSTKDGGAIGIGYDSFVGNQILFKMNSSGNIEWQKEYGSSRDPITDIQEKTNGGYTVVEQNLGFMGEGLADVDWHIFELDENGTKVPGKEIQLGGSDRDFAQKLVQTQDGGSIVVGYGISNDGDFSANNGDYDCWILKLDDQMKKVWLKNYGGTSRDKGFSIKAAQDGGYVVFGTTISNDGNTTTYNFRVFKIDENGNIVWDETYGGTKEETSIYESTIKPVDLQLTDDGGYVFLGSTDLNNGDITENHGDQDYWFVKINQTGKLVYQKTYGGSEKDEPIRFIKAHNEGYMITGKSYSHDGDFDQGSDNVGWIIQIDESGEIIWKWNYGVEALAFIQSSLDDGYFFSSKIEGIYKVAKFYPGDRPYLNELKIDNQDFKNFVEDKFDYEVTLPYGTETVPIITAKELDMDTTINIIQATSLPGIAKVEVNKDGTILNTYSIQFTLEKNINAYLSDLRINDATVSDFVYNQYTYEIELPYGSSTVPIVTSTSQDPNATVSITQAKNVQGTANISVTSQDSNISNAYTIKFSVAEKDTRYLKNLKINDETVSEFVYNRYNYEIELPYGSTKIPVVTATAQDSDTTVNITQSDSLATIHVLDEKGILLNTYTIYFTLEKSNNAYLNDLRVDDETVSGFVYNHYSYEIELPYGSTKIPIVTPLSQDPNVTIQVNNATRLPDTTEITVLSKDEKTTRTYKIKFVIKDQESNKNGGSSNNENSNDNTNKNNNKSSNNRKENKNEINPLERPKELLQKTVETLKNKQTNKETMIDTTIKMINEVPSIIQTVHQPQKIVEAVTSMIKNTEAILSDPNTELQKREELKTAIIHLAEKAMDKVGQLNIPSSDIQLKGNTAKASVSSQWIQKQIESTEKNLNNIKDSLRKAVGEEAEEAKVSLSINMPESIKNMQKVSIDFQKEILTQIEKKNIDRIVFNLNYVGLTVEPDTFKNIKEQEYITLEESINNTNTQSLPTDIEKIDGIPILDIHAKVQNEKIKSFKKPIEVYFNLSNIDLSKYSKEDLESLTAYLYDEKEQNWKAVGGKYDATTNRINVYRIHLSTYTVMKSNKTFSDIKKHDSKKEINLLLKKGILADENEFMPNKEVSREEFVGWISKNFGLETEEIDLPFKDLDRSNPQYKEIASAFDQGLIKGKKNDIFAPTANITKQEAAVTIANALKKYEKINGPKDKGPYLAQYDDQSEIALWSKDAIAVVSQKRLYDKNQNQYNPTKSMTRTDAALMVYNLQDHL